MQVGHWWGGWAGQEEEAACETRVQAGRRMHATNPAAHRICGGGGGGTAADSADGPCVRYLPLYLCHPAIGNNQLCDAGTTVLEMVHAFEEASGLKVGGGRGTPSHCGVEKTP